VAQATAVLHGTINTVEYAVWVTHRDGQLDPRSPHLVVTDGSLHFGDKLPLANVSCWITEVIEGEWIGAVGRVFEGRAYAAAGPGRDPDEITVE
jgi:hypothetical protein